MSAAQVALCAIMKDEAPSIMEWVAWHRLIGFEPIVVYSNDCSDGSFELLEALHDCGALIHRRQVTPRDGSAQHIAYKDALKRSGADWMAFLDADEFLALKRDATVQDFMARFGAEVSGVGVNWRVFGSAGKLRWEPGLVIERFPRASVPQLEINHFVKSIVRPRDVVHMAVHFAVLARGAYVDAGGRPFGSGAPDRTARVDYDVAQVNHYCVKSREEFVWKKRRGVADKPLGAPDKFTSRDTYDFFGAQDRNEEEDLTLAAQGDRVREEMARLREGLRQVGFLAFS
jgi:hypothetical protein